MAEAEPAPVAAKDEKQRRSRKPGKRAVSVDREADKPRPESKKPDRRQQKNKEQQEAAEQTAGKTRRKQQRLSRPKVAEKERSASAPRAARANPSQGRRPQSRRETAPPQLAKQETRPRSSRGREDREEKRVSPPDFDYLGREVQRTQPNRRSERALDSFYDNRASRQGYQRRGAPYEVGQSYRYMPNFHEERDTYFSQYDRSAAGRSFRGGRDQPRPGYFPAARRPQRPEQLVDDFSVYQNQRRY